MKREEQPYNRTLSIRIDTNGFCFCTYTPSSPGSVEYHFHNTDKEKSLYANLCKAIEECPLALEGVTQIKAIIATNNFTTIPAEHDNKQSHKVFYRYCFPKSDTNTEIIANRLTAQNTTLLFPVDKNIYNRLAQMGNVTYYTPASILLGYMAHTPFENERYLLAYYQQNTSLLVSVKGGKIELINSFPSENDQNQLYYLLAIWKAQGFSQTDDTLYLCGDKRVEELSLAISRFIRNRRRINPTERFAPNLLNKIGNIPFDLQALILCE